MIEHLEGFDPRWLKTHCYALIDASRRDEVAAAWPTTVVAPAFLGSDTARSPLLLRFAEMPVADQSTLMERFERETTERADTFCSLLFASTERAPLLVAHLAKRMVLTVPGSATPKQWRYFDPGTFLQLPRLLGSQGMAWLLGPVESVLVPWAGHWTRLTRPGEPARRFRLQAEHLEGLSRIGVINRSLLQRPPPTNAAMWMNTCAELDIVARRAIQRHSLRRQRDLEAFAGHALTHHPHFDAHPRVVGLLERLKAAQPDDELDYEELTSELSDKEWQAICRDLQDSVSITAFREGQYR